MTLEQLINRPPFVLCMESAKKNQSLEQLLPPDCVERAFAREIDKDYEKFPVLKLANAASSAEIDPTHSP